MRLFSNFVIDIFINDIIEILHLFNLLFVDDEVLIALDEKTLSICDVS